MTHERFISKINNILQNFQNFDKNFESLVKKFEKENFGSGFGMETPQDIGEYDWRETPTQQIFVLKVKQSKDKPLDIKIEKGQLKLKGDVESIDLQNPKTHHSTKVHFERDFVILPGVDQTNPEFENSAGELLIKFKKLKTVNELRQIKNTKPIDQKSPIGKDAKDLTI